MNKKKLVVLTGSGISAESGIPTFRGAADSLWEGVNVMEVCRAGCLKVNEDNTYAFYNMLRNKYKDCKPNAAHYALAELEKDYDVTIITQNVDNLHEKAGSSHVIHLHGELMKCRDTGNTKYIYDIPQDENGEYNIYPTTRIDGRKVRPHVVFFGEDVPNLPLAASYVKNADICIVIGTSFVVYPAAGLVDYVPYGNPIYYIDPNPAYLPDYPDVQIIKATASEGMKELKLKLTKKIIDEDGLVTDVELAKDILCEFFRTGHCSLFNDYDIIGFLNRVKKELIFNGDYFTFKGGWFGGPEGACGYWIQDVKDWLKEAKPCQSVGGYVTDLNCENKVFYEVDGELKLFIIHEGD